LPLRFATPFRIVYARLAKRTAMNVAFVKSAGGLVKSGMRSGNTHHDCVGVDAFYPQLRARSM
jgi:hypothetical protein